MIGLVMKITLAGVLSAHILVCLSSPSPNARTSGSTFSNIYTALSSMLKRPSATSFSSSLLPPPPPSKERRHFKQTPKKSAKKKNTGFLDPPVSNPVMSSSPKLSTEETINGAPLEKITKASLGPVKRNAQLDIPGYSYLVPDNKLRLPGEQDRDSVEVIFPTQFKEFQSHENMENPKRQKLKGKIVFKKNDEELTGVEALQALNEFLESDEGTKLLDTAAQEAERRKDSQKLSESDTSRSNSFASLSRTVTAAPVILSSTPGTIRLIQPIQILSTPNSRSHASSNSRSQASSNSRSNASSNSRSQASSSFRASNNLPNSSRPKTLSSFTSLFSSPHPKPRVPKQQAPALTFVDNGLFDVLGRQVSGTPVEGFPNGLPDLTPLGVRLTLENMFGPNGDIIMNPIPGEAGVDYPTYNTVPDTGFSCSAQEYPGIFVDTQSDCQTFYMCQPNGESSAFLCPNGTMFNQQYFVCDWWYNIDCADQPSFYNLNQLIYETPAEEGKVCKSLFCKDD